jgi:putative heme-binding domain-containing protein
MIYRQFRFAIGCLVLAGVFAIASLSVTACAEDPFALGVRETPKLSPEDEQKAFKLPEGFEATLVAAEPDIQKPLNMAFDERGRIWLTCTLEYPYAAPLGKPARDSIRVLEDTDGDGRFEKVTIFADGLNIPMGIYPYKGGCIAYSIPNLWHFEDVDGDGKCDKRTKLYGPFDHTRDTHGMVNALRRGFDGWLYACHGFNNDSHVKGADGHEVHMNSGNTFRVKLDGSRIEHFTHGQVNPFGMTLDPSFNLFTADCHSKPIYQLLRGGFYPSFGKPNDGLGEVPPMMDHLHGSTAICGLIHYTGDNFPREYRGQMLSGNVMTSRINRNWLERRGSTIRANELPDFLSTSDPWFRPVDLQIGPDGAMYVLDFYNRIIGHYEVPLPHPGRDRESGRIWRIAYTGNAEGTKPAVMPPDLKKLSTAAVVAELDGANLERRLVATHWLVDEVGPSATDEVRKAFESPRSAHQQVHAMWVLERLGKLDAKELLAAGESKHADVRVHAMKILSERKEWSWPDGGAAIPGLDDDNAFVVRAAADAAGRHPKLYQFKHLLPRLSKAPKEDNHLRQVLRMALRDNLAALESADDLKSLELNEKDLSELASIAVAVPNETSAAFLVDYLAKHTAPRDTLLAGLQHAVRYVPNDRIPALVSLAQSNLTGDLELQQQMLESLQNGLSQRGIDPTKPLAEWGTMLVKQLLQSEAGEAIGWTPIPVEGASPSPEPWVLQKRESADGDKASYFYCSLPKGETLTGVYRSDNFALPETLSFWCAGHSGMVGSEINDRNWIRLRHAETNQILAESRPTRNDIAQRIEWQLKKHEGQQAYIELVDNDTGSGWAWLAAGRFSVPGLNPSPTGQRQAAAANLVAKLKLHDLRPEMVAVLIDPKSAASARGAVGQALVTLDPDARAVALVIALADPTLATLDRPSIAAAITSRETESLQNNLREVMKIAPLRLQTSMAEALAGDERGLEALANLVEAGQASGRLLTVPNVQTKLAALKNDKLNQRISELAARLAPTEADSDRLLAERRDAFKNAMPSLDRGQEVFTKNCASCHQVAGKGATVGPQLDGIGQRGLDRLVEDVLEPNRNVDVAFRTSTLQLADGRVVSGLVRREEGAVLILADNMGKEFSVPKEDIEDQKKSALSLMPANVREILTPDQFNDLLAYLLNQRGSKPTP